MCRSTKMIKRMIAAILVVALLVNNDYSGFFTVKAQGNAGRQDLALVNETNAGRQDLVQANETTGEGQVQGAGMYTSVSDGDSTGMYEDVSDGDAVVVPGVNGIQNNEISTITLTGKLNEFGYARLTWNPDTIFHEEIGNILLYKDDVLYKTLDAEAEEFCDEEIDAATKYTYYVAATDTNGNIIARSDSVKIEAPAALTVSNGYTLTEDRVVYSLTLSSGILNLNGYSLTVLRDANLKYGALSFNNGALHCYGNLDLTRNVSVYMDDANDYLLVKKNITWETPYTNKGSLTNGIIEVCGNFTQTYGSGFKPSEYHKVIFSGEGQQVITLSGTGSRFNIIELRNYSPAGVYSQTELVYNELIRNGCRLSLGDVDGEYGFDVQEDMTIEGDFCLVADTLNLNGHTLTIQGDLIQAGGIVNINGGKLLVEGDYRMQTVSSGEESAATAPSSSAEEPTAYAPSNGAEAAYTYASSGGSLIMQQEEDYVLVKGSFFTATNVDHTGYLTNGVLEVKGDFTQLDSATQYGFVATENHTLLLSGDTKQTVTFHDNTQGYSHLHNLELQNTSEEGIVFEESVFALGLVKQNKGPVSGSLTIKETTAFEGNEYFGDVYIRSGKAIQNNLTIHGNVTMYATVNISGTLTIGGNLTQSGGCVYMEGGQLYVSGDYKIDISGSSYGLSMINDTDYIYVGGDFSADFYYAPYLKAGTLEVAENFTTDGAFDGKDSHKVILAGDKKQSINMDADAYFATLELRNYSAEGVYSAKALRYTTIIRNDCKLQYGDMEGIWGWTLKEDQVYEGDLVLIADTLNLNGYSLTIKGDLIQAGGILNINGGELIVEGDLRLQMRNGEEGAYTYGESTGILCMQKEKDYVLVKGSFHTATNADHRGYLTEGVLEVWGNFTQLKSNMEYSFKATDNHTLLLSGNEKQTVAFRNTAPYYSNIANLELANTSDEGVAFGSNVYVANQVKQNTTAVSGTLYIGPTTSFFDNSYNGDVRISYEGTIDGEYTINGAVTVASKTTISGNVTINGDVTLEKAIEISGNLTINGNLTDAAQGGYVKMQGGSLSVSGDFVLDYYRVTGLLMENATDYVYVGGKFYVYYFYTSTLTAGTLEVAGDFAVGNQFHPQGSHRVILSGEGKQTVNLYDGAYFATLELRNYSEEGVYSDKVFPYTTLIRNNCKLQYGDVEGIFGWTLEENQVYEGDLVLIADTLNLNGYSLTIKGDLILAGGILNINGGELIVEGDLRLQTRSGAADAYTYAASAGILCMQKEADHVLVKGDLVTRTTANLTGYLTAGVLEVQGDFTRLGSDKQYDFVATEHHTLLLSGSRRQTITFEYNASGYSSIANLELANTSDEGVTFGTDVYVTGQIKQNHTPVSGSVEIGSSTSFYENKYSGDVLVASSKTISDDVTITGNVTLEASVTLSGTLTITGNLKNTSRYGYVYMKGGQLYVAGDYTIRRLNSYNVGFTMANDADYVYVGGNFAFNTYTSTMSAGTLEVAGDFKTDKTFRPRGSHKVILSGDKKQTVDMAAEAGFVTLELRNYSKEGVCSATALNYTTLIRNGCNLRYEGSEGVFGWTLPEDTAVEGDLILLDDTLNLNGHTLTVTGDLIHMGGEIIPNGGTLNISGDYRQQSRSGTEGAYTYAAGNGRLVMSNEADQIHVAGDFVMQPAKDTGVCFTAGELRVDGDFTQLGSYDFQAGETHSLIFAGKKARTISAEEAMTVGNLTIDNGGSEAVTIAAAITALGQVTDNNGKLAGDGTLSLAKLENLTDNSWSGNLILTEDNILTADLTVGNRLTLNGALDVNGHTLYAGAIGTTDYFYLQNGTVSCKGNFVVNREGRLVMQDAAGYLLVGGNFSISSKYSHKGLLTDGVLELRGDFTQSYTNNFIATENHTTILSKKRSAAGRSYIQTITFAHAGNARFNTLVLKKPMEEYQFANDTGLICNALICAYEDTVAPTELGELYASHKGVTEIMLGYPAAEDESGVAGYEIYRNGIKIAVTSNHYYKDSGLQPGTTYTYTVYAFDEYNNIATTSPELIVNTLEDREAPDMVAQPYVATRTGSSITLSWNPASDNVKTTGYNVYRNEELIAEGLTATTYKDAGLSRNVIYTYAVEAIDAAGNISQRSEAASATVGLPSITYLSPGDYSSLGGDSVELSVRFKNVGNSTGNKIKIEYKTAGEAWKPVTSTLLAQKTYNSTTLCADYDWDISGLSGDKEYIVRYTLYDGDNNTDVREVNYLIDKEAPEKVAGLAATADNGMVRLTWEVSPGADCAEYRIYRKREDADSFSLLTALKGRNVSYYGDKDVEEGITYTYLLSAVDAYDNESALSEGASVTVDADNSAPVVKKLTPSAGKINAVTTLTATATDNLAVKQIQLQVRKDGDSQWTTLAAVDAVNGEATYSWDTTAYEDGVYYINAVAMDAGGNESKEEYTRRYTIDNTGISKVTITGAEAGATSVRLHWQDVTDTDFAYFQVEQKTQEGYEKVGVTHDTLGYTVSNLQPGTAYTFLVVGYDTLGNRGEESGEYTIATISDRTGPRITGVYPIASYYRNTLKLKAMVEDNHGVGYAVFSYSLDGESFTEIAGVEATGDAKSTTLSQDFDISSFAEGSLFIKFEAYDKAGNKNLLPEGGEEIIVEYRIDRTAPARVQDAAAVDGDGYVELTWSTPADTDIHHYRIYRADNEDGIFRVLSDNCTTLNYYDTNVTEGSSYIYKLEAVDMAGNVGEASGEIIATVSADDTAPTITGMTPANGGTVGANPLIKALALDNAGLASVRMEYRAADAPDGIWYLMGETRVNERSALAEIPWNTEGLEEGRYRIRAIAADRAGNVSEAFEITCSLDLTAPALPIVTVTNGHFEIGISMEPSKDGDFAQYEIQRRTVEETTWQTIARTAEQNYTDKDVAVDTVYLYRVAAYDRYGNFARSAELQGYADAVDVLSPTVSVTENMIGLAGMELAFDGMGSTDNVRITEYRWDMGNGDILYGAQPRYTYQEAGTYMVKLTATDAAGNSADGTINVRISEKTGKGVAEVRIVNESGEPIPHAYVYMQLAEGNNLSLRADSEGYVTVVENTGLYKLAAYANGYIPDDIEIILNEYEDKKYTLTLVEDELIVGDLTVHRMSLEEMVEAGVDFSDPANYHSYAFYVELTFKEEPKPTGFHYIYQGGGGSILKQSGGSSGSNRKRKVNLGKPRIPGDDSDEGTPEMEQPILAYITTVQSVTWLKDMYEVELGVLNAADAEYVIEDAVATLNLPETGVTLVQTQNGRSLTQSMGDIAGQERKSASWVVRGDVSGRYIITADLEGRLMPFDAKVSAHFEMENDFEVTTGEGLCVYIIPEQTAYIGEKYYIQFVIWNGSDHPFYNVKTTFGAFKIPDYTYTVTNVDTGEVYEETISGYEIADPAALYQPAIVGEDGTVSMRVLNPGEALYGTFVTTFEPETDSDPEEVYYRLIDDLVEVMQGENLGVNVSVMPTQGHISKTNLKIIVVPSFYGDPIDVTTGYFVENITPLMVTGATPLTFDLNYSSGVTDVKGDMGYGWYHDYEVYLEEKRGLINFYINPYTAIPFIKEDLHLVRFGDLMILAEGEEYSYGEYTCISSLYQGCSLNKNTDGTYTLTMPNGARYEFDTRGRLTAIFDMEGKSVSLSHQDKVTVVTETISGKHLYLHYNSEGRLVSVSDDAGRETVFGYDEHHNMTTLTDPTGNTLTYSYDDQHRILSEGNAQGVYVTNVYDEEGRVIKQTDALGNVMTGRYEETEEGMKVTFTDAAGKVNTAYVNKRHQLTKAIDSEGRYTEYQYNSEGSLVYEKDAYGNAIYQEYDSEGNMVKVTDKGGIITTMTYDANGNVISITNAKGKKATFTYGSNNLLTSSTDYNGLTTTYAYDDNGQVIRQTTEGLGSVEYTYENGLVTSVRDYMGNVTTARYDGAGNLVAQTDALGNTVTYAYDNMARVTRMTDSAGNSYIYSYDCNGNRVAETDALGNTIRYQYDRAGNQTHQINPDGTTIEYIYDCNGNCTQTKFADGTSNYYTYDGSGNLIKEVMADGTTLTYTYDLLNQRTSETDRDGRKVSYEYYPNGNLYKTTYPDGTYEFYTYDQSWKVIAVTDQAGHTTSYEYDNMGNVTMERDALGNTYRYEYDTLGRLTKETDANGNSTTYTYDANSNCIKKTNALGVSVHMTYDALNRMTSAYTTDRNGTEYRVSYTYDALGRVISSTDEEGNTTHMTYDAVGNLISMTDAKGTVTGVSSYDSMGRVTTVTDALGVTTNYSYDVMGNLIKAAEILNSGEIVTSYSYDTLGRMTSVTDALQGVTSVTYDGRGNVSTLTDANGGTTAYTYDNMDRLTLEVSPLGSRTAYTYNAEGLLAELENARGQKTTYTYDAIGRVTSMTDELGTVKYTYDANGNVLTVEDANGKIIRKYDALNRVTEYTDYRGNTVKYSYDQIGNLVALTYPGGKIVRYTYYKNGWLHTVTDIEGKVTTYEYDCNGNMTRCTRPNGTAEICTYDAAGMLISQKDVKIVSDGGGGCQELPYVEEILTEFNYTYDERGNITAISGTETTDDISALKSAEMAYDADNRLISYNGEEIRYDADGNMTYGPVNGVMSELIYDCRNRLVSAGGVRYTYDAENIRIAVETDEYVEEYVTDTVSSSLSRVLTTTRYEKTESGTLSVTGDVTTYIYGYGLISEYQGDIVLYHHYNNLGSTMKLTDALGNVVASYTYGAYGELLSGDTGFTSFLYNGRCGVMTDDNGLYYMRQRYYNTEIKRFINQDVIRGSITNSQSLNRYSYVQGNPISYTDPFGLSPVNGLFSGTTFTHVVLGMLGAVPGPIGVIANLADAAVYAFIDHDYGMAAWSVVSAGAMGAGSIVKMAKAGSTLSKGARYVGLTCSTVSNGINLFKNGEVVVNTVAGMYQKYVVEKQAVSGETGIECLQLGLALFGCYMSGKGISEDTQALAKMLKEDNVAGRLKNALSNGLNGIKKQAKAFAMDNRGCGDLSFFGIKSGSKAGKALTKPNIVNFDSKQLGKKWGKHKTDYPDMKSYTDYQNYANDVFNNPEQIIYDAANNEYLYTKGDDLLRLGEDGEFISLYPGVQSGKVTSAIENGGTIWP